MKWPFGKKEAAEGPQDSPTEPTDPVQKPGLLGRLFEGLRKSSGRLAENVAAVFTKKKLDAETLDELEEVLIAADLGTATAHRLRLALAKDRFGREVGDAEIREALAQELAEILRPREGALEPDPARKPHVILFVGVNGSGKTTTIGKLAVKWAAAGHRIAIAAGDTFRAAAIDQLAIWAARSGAQFIAKGPGADPAGLAWEALERARADGLDLLLIDTAGRLQNKTELMSELAKIVRVLRKIDPEAPHDVVLVLDATVGQNALSQAEAFRAAAGVTGIVMTKLDGTAKGGVLAALAEKHALPVHFVGVGEAAEDLQPFGAEAFARALTGAG